MTTTMSNHGLSRNSDNDPVCLCGYKPVEDLYLSWPIRQLRAKTTILDHAKELNETPLRSPDDPFVVADAKYPRAGVRPMRDGRWLLTLWDEGDVLHPIPDPDFDDLTEAFEYGWMTIGACRQSGTSLNGMAAA